jgi:ribosomal 30S subunit maturation factor RimM
VYVVKGGAQEVLIPALESVVLNIDTEHNRMEVDLPEGLT